MKGNTKTPKRLSFAVKIGAAPLLAAVFMLLVILLPFPGNRIRVFAESLTSRHIVNPPIDISTQDRTRLEWGQGRNFDALNRPGGAVAYQQIYGGLSGYFLGPWQPGSPKVIYLTSDLGYVNQATTDFLNALKAKQVPCVFFVTLNVMENNPDIILRIIGEGHELANHSATHPAKGLPSQSLDSQIKEILLPHEKALRDYGYEMHLFRFPAGIFSAQTMAVVNNLNYRSVFWSYAYRDWDPANQPDVNSSFQKAVERLHPGAIYLLHGISSTNAAMLPAFVDAARAQGYEFALLQ